MPLTIQHQPVSVTFGIFDLSEGTTSSHCNTQLRLVVDPTAVEEEVATGIITLSVNRQGEIVSMVKRGGLGVDPELIHGQCLELAKTKAVAFGDLLATQLSKRS